MLLKAGEEEGQVNAGRDQAGVVVGISVPSHVPEDQVILSQLFPTGKFLLLKSFAHKSLVNTLHTKKSKCRTLENYAVFSIHKTYNSIQ